MQTIYMTDKIDFIPAMDLAFDYPEIFQSVRNALEVIDMDAAFALSGDVEVFEDEETNVFYLKVDGVNYPLSEA